MLPTEVSARGTHRAYDIGRVLDPPRRGRRAVTSVDIFPTPDAPQVAVAGDGPVRAAAAVLADHHGMTTTTAPPEPEPSDLLVAGSVPDCVVVETPESAERVTGLLDRSIVVYADLPDDAVAALVADEDVDYVSAAGDTADHDLLAARVRAATRDQRRSQELTLRAAAMDQAGVGISIADARHPDEMLVYVNEGFADITDYEVGETVGRNCRFLQGPDTDEDTVAEIRAALDEDEPVSVDILNYRADGEPFWNQLDVAPVADDDGTVTHYFGFQKDITERKRLEARLERENERLSSFASVVSHDLRNPLAVAQSAVSTVRETAEPDVAEDLERADDALDRIESLIDGLLALARQGATVDEPEPTSIPTAVTKAWSTVEAPSATLTLGDDVGTVRADPERLRTLFENLFRNAVQHGAPDVHVHVGATPDGFYVEDDGPGIPPEECERVFEQGFTTAEEGTGLGLAIVHSIAQAHGWTADVETGADGGARFVFVGLGAG
jgi:PAS domain S-box-containing protein